MKNNYNFVIHLSDIHIRHEIDREEEYTVVFENLFSSIKNKINNENTLIIIAGDLIHNKVRITPVVLFLVNKLLTGLSELGTVVLIDGNHDINVGNENDKKLLEVISKPKNVNYISNTGEYVFNNITLGVSTLVDNKFIKFSEIKKKNQINLAVGHYTLKEWLDERNIPAMTRVKCVYDFEGYDYALLGDIHSRKNYGHCRYSGSLIQQNFSEGLKHGYSIYDIKKSKWNNINIKSIYAFYNIKVNDNGNLNIPDSIDFTTYSYIKLHLDKKFLDREDDYKREIGKNTIIKRFVRCINSNNNILTDDSYFDTEDTILEKPLTEEQIINKLLINNKNIDKILDLHNKFKTQSYNYIQNRNKWILKTLRFENILKYRKEHLLNFENIHGITGISGLNASGKSSILKILIFGLSGELSVDYAPVNSDYVKTSQSYNYYKFDTINILNYDIPLIKRGFIEICIEYNSKDYKLYRFIERKGSAISTNTTISILEDDKWTITHTSMPNSKSRITEKEVNKVIYNMIGRSTDLFILNVINKNSGSIIDNSDIGRFNVFSNIFNLNSYNDIANNVKLRILELKEEISKNKGKREQAVSKTNFSINNIDIDKTREKIIQLENIKKIANSIKNNSIKSNRDPNLLNLDIHELKDKFDSLCNLKNKLLKDIKEVPDGLEKITEKSKNIIYKNYKDVMNTKKPEKFDIIEEPLPSPYKTDIKSEDVNKLENIIKQYKYKENILEEEDKFRKILISFNRNHINVSPDVKKIKLVHPKIDNIIHKITLNKKILKELNKEETEKELKMLPSLNYKHIDKKREIKGDKIKLKSTINNSLDKIKPLIEIGDIIESLENNNIQKDHILRLKDITNIKDLVIEISGDLSKSAEMLRTLEIDEEHNKVIEENILYNQEVKRVEEKRKELTELIDQKIKYDHNKRVEELEPYFVEINRRLTYIQKYKQYKDLKYKYLQNLSHLKEQKDNYDKKLEYESYIRFFNRKLLENIQDIDNEFADINHTSQKILDSTYKEIENLRSMIDAKMSTIEIGNSIEELVDELENLTIYSKLIKEDIKIVILSSYLDQISDFINDILSNLVSFSIKLVAISDANEKTNRVKLNIIRNNSTGAYSLSAFEEFALNLVSKIVLNVFSNSSTATFMILDECLECIDSQNKIKIENLFKMLSSKYKHILLITHIEEYFEICNHKIEVNNGKFKVI